MRPRTLRAALVLATTAGLTLSATTVAAQAAEVTSTVGGVTYRADDAAVSAGATVVEVTADAPKALIIPASVVIGTTTYAVRSVGEGAADDLGLTSLGLPGSLTSIGDSAFSGNALTTVALPDSVTSLGTGVFSLNQLTSVDLPDALTVVPSVAFAGNALTSVQLPSGLTAIGTSAFGFNSLTSVTIPASVTSIASGAFTENRGLASVVFTGPPPTDFTATGGDGVGSLGDESDLTVTFPARFAAPGYTGGYTTPTWMGYASKATATPPPPTTQRPRLQILNVKRTRQNNGVFRFKVTTLNRGPGRATQISVRIANRPRGVSFVRRAAQAGSPQAGQRTTSVLQVRAATRPVKLRVQARAENAVQSVRLVRLPRR